MSSLFAQVLIHSVFPVWYRICKENQLVVIAAIGRFSVMEKKVLSNNTYYISCLVPFKRISKTDTFLISQIDIFPHLIKQE